MDEVRTKSVIDHILASQPDRYNNVQLKPNEFLIAVNLQYAPFKKSIVAYNIIDVDTAMEHHNEPAYRLLSKFVSFQGIKYIVCNALILLSVKFGK